MDLQELAARTTIPVRRLRHCLDEGLLPGLRIETTTHETGRPRKFHDDVGFAICCAATLIDAKIDRSIVRVFMRGLATVPFRKSHSPVIIAVFERRARGIAQLGDNRNMRVELELPSEGTYDTRWVRPGDRAKQLADSYRPLTTIGLDLGHVGEKVFGW